MKSRLLSIEELRKYHTQKTTDFAYLLGAWKTENPKEKYQAVSEEDRCDSPRFSSTINGYGWVSSFYPNGEDWAFQDEADMSCPLVLERNSVDDSGVFFLNKKGHLLDEDENKTTFLFGAYPQKIATEKEAEMLEKKFTDGNMIKTGHAYTYFVNNFKDNPLAQQQQKCFEYESNGNRYVRITPNKMHFLHYGFTLSNGQKIESEKPYWIRVESLKWSIFDKKLRPLGKLLDVDAYSDVVPVAGIAWGKMDEFLSKYFSKEILQSNDFCLKKFKESMILKMPRKKLTITKMHD